MGEEDLSYAHAVAVKVLAEAGTSYRGYIGEVNAEDPLEYPYFCVWVPPGNRSSSTLATRQSIEFRSVIQITISGRDVRETATAADRIAAAVVDHKPAVAGRRNVRCTQIPQSIPISAPPGDRDPATGRQVFETSLQVAIFSLPDPAA